MGSAGNTLKVGSDEVHFAGEFVIIHAATEISDWTSREYSRSPVWFQGKKYFLSGKGPVEPPFVMRYKLAPWPAEFHEESKISYVYDEDFVTERDRDFKRGRQSHHAKILLMPLYPLLGFAWSGLKEKVLSPWGFESKSITDASLMLQFGLVLLQVIYVGFLRGGAFQFFWRGGEMPFFLDWVLLLGLAADGLVRANQRLSNEAVFPYGFLEWLVKIKRARD
jgi:hypothetical protein